MEFVQIPAGAFTMGKFQPVCATVGTQGNVTEAQYAECMKLAEKAARPGFEAKIPAPFYIGKYEVTQQQYAKVMGRNPSWHGKDRTGEDTANYPVDSVTWKDAQAFVKKLNALEKTKAYRLPTEAEWEYAARAGATAEMSGPDRQAAAWFMSNSKYVTHPVGQKKPNAWGLYDTLGNVWEWVSNLYDTDYAPTSPTGPKTGKEHVLKGGSAFAHEKNVRFLVHAGGPGAINDTGFRIVKDAR
jgi:formylglycine-generating enzyme required for sulfatase activity